MSKYKLENEYSIKLSGLVVACVKKVRFIVICAVVCAAAIFAFSFTKVKSENANYQALEGMTLEQFSSQDIAQAEQYYGMEKTALSKEKYVSDSYYMLLDGSQINVTVLQFAFESSKTEMSGVGKNQLSNYITSGGLAADVSAECEEYVAQYLQEIIIYTPDSFLMKLLGNSSESNQKLAAVILEKMQQKVVEMGTDNNCVYTIRCLSEENALLSDNGVITNQTNRRNELLTINNSKMNIRNSLTETQLRVVDLMHQRDGFEAPLLYNHEPAQIKKWIPFAGFVFGIILGVFLIFVQYYFSTSIKEKDALKSIFEIPYWGGATTKTKKSKLLERFINEAPHSDMRQEELEKRISKICANNNISQLFIVGFEECENFIESDVISFVDKHCIDQLQTGASVLLMIKLNKTKWSEVRNVVEEIQLQNCEVVGYITIE